MCIRNQYKRNFAYLFQLLFLVLLSMNVHAQESYNFVGKWGIQTPDGKFNTPRNIATDSAGNVYVADTDNHRIQKFDSNGLFISQWGSFGGGNGQFSFPSAIVVDANNNVYVANSSDVIQKFDSNGLFISRITFPSTEVIPVSITEFTVDSNGNIYVIGFMNNKVSKYSSTGQLITQWEITTPMLGGLQAIAVDNNNNIYVVGYSMGIQKFTSTGILITQWDQGSSYSDITVGLDGFVYAFSGNTIRQYIPDGQFSSSVTLSALPNLVSFLGTKLAINATGLYIADISNRNVQIFTVAGQFLKTLGSYVPADGQFYRPSGIAKDANGNIYVADTENNRIQKFTSNGQFLAKWGSQGYAEGQFYRPNGIAVDSAGNVYVADSGNARIQKFTSGGQFLAKWGSYGSDNGLFSYIQGIAVDSNSNIYVADSNNNRIQKFTNNGVFISTWGTFGATDGQFISPQGIAIDSGGNIYVADSNNNRIQKFTSDGQFILKWGSFGSSDGQFISPQGITVDNAGNVYVVDGSNRIQKFTSDGQFVTKWGSYGSLDGQFDVPEGLVVDSSGNVYVVDSWNKRIQKFAPSSTTPTPPTVAALDCTQPATYDTTTHAITLPFIDTMSFNTVTGNPNPNEIMTFSGKLQQSSKQLDFVNNTHFKVVDNSLQFLSSATNYTSSHARYTFDNAFSLNGGMLELCVQVPSTTVIPLSAKVSGAPKNYMMKLQQVRSQSSVFNVLNITPVNP